MFIRLITRELFCLSPTIVVSFERYRGGVRPNNKLVPLFDAICINICNLISIQYIAIAIVVCCALATYCHRLSDTYIKPDENTTLSYSLLVSGTVT